MGDAFGCSGDTADDVPLLVVALGPQNDALANLVPPDNALCLPTLPQVDILKAGVDLFLTHGGQNSFTEALAEGVPVVVCPGFGDQSVNARKAVNLRVGLQVERPVPASGDEEQAMEMYRTKVRGALLQVHSQPSYTERAQACAERLRASGGVSRAVDLIHEIADKGLGSARLPTLLGRPCAGIEPSEADTKSGVLRNKKNKCCCGRLKVFALSVLEGALGFYHAVRVDVQAHLLGATAADNRKPQAMTSLFMHSLESVVHKRMMPHMTLLTVEG